MSDGSSAKPKVALVTGAAKRIGRVIALEMARQGWDIIVHYGQSGAEAEHTVAEIRQLGRQATALACDLADSQAVSQLAARAAACFGGLDCIVNSAALFIEDQAQDVGQALLDQHMHVNLLAPLLLARGLHQLTAAGQQAVVVNILDQKLHNLNPDYLSYTLSKAALETATTMLAQAFAPRLRVVGVAPGITLLSGEQSEADFCSAHQVTPLGKSSTPADVAATVCFVASQGAITGTTILVDGGQHLIPTQRDVMFLATAKATPSTSTL